MTGWSLAAAAAVLALAGCAAAPAQPPGTLRAEGEAVRLVLIDAASAAAELAWTGYAGDTAGVDADAEQAVRRLCGAPPAAALAAVTPADVLGLLVKPVAALIVGAIDRAIQAEIDAHVAAYSASAVTERFYAATDPALELRWTCFRFTRTLPGEHGPGAALDLVGQMRLAEDGGALMLRPLRLYLGKPRARGARIGLAASLRAEAVALDGATRRAETTFDVVLLSEARAAGTPSVRYYAGSGIDAPFVPVKLPPWTRRTAHAGASGNVTLTLSVAETGVTPAYLNAVAAVFAGSKNDLGKLIVKALEPLLER